MSDPSTLRAVIAELLRRNWNPLPDSDTAAQDDFVAHVHEMLVARESESAIAEYLVAVETEALGFRDTDPKTLIPLAKKLRNLTREGVTAN